MYSAQNEGDLYSPPGWISVGFIAQVLLRTGGLGPTLVWINLEIIEGHCADEHPGCDARLI